MKRVLLGIGWFTIINLVLNMIMGGFVGFTTGSAQAGAEAGARVSQQYGWIVIIVSALIAIIGTLTGKLPYTKKDNK